MKTASGNFVSPRADGGKSPTLINKPSMKRWRCATRWFLHISALQSSGIDPDNIRKGERLTFDVESTRDGKTRVPTFAEPAEVEEAKTTPVHKAKILD